MTPEPVDRWVDVYRERFRLVLFARPEGSWKFRPVRSYEIGIGMDGMATNPGHYLISDKQRRPTWVPPDSEWVDPEIRGRRFEADDPANPIKARWLGWWDAEGIHGIARDKYDTIGTAASHGCVRMRQEDVVELFERVPLYTPVRIY